MPGTMSSSDKSYQLHLIITPMVQLTHITTQFIKLKRKGFVCSNNCFINIKLVKNLEALDLDSYCLYTVLFWFALIVVHWRGSCILFYSILLIVMVILLLTYIWLLNVAGFHRRQNIREQNGYHNFESLRMFLSILNGLK